MEAYVQVMINENKFLEKKKSFSCKILQFWSSNHQFGIQIRIELKCLILIRIEISADLQHWLFQVYFPYNY
jgi:hypothetical protein